LRKAEALLATIQGKTKLVADNWQEAYTFFSEANSSSPSWKLRIVQSQQLLPKSEIFKEEVLSGSESIDNPSQEMSEQRDCGQNHDQNLIETRRLRNVQQ
jgi:hypothetical protein